MIIAVDFDGTIVEHRYPRIGKPIPNAVEVLKKLQQECHLLILWTVREGELLNEAVEYCRKMGVEFYAINGNHPDEDKQLITRGARKVCANIYIDDCNLGGLPDWNLIYEMIHFKRSYEEILFEQLKVPKPVAETNFWTRFFTLRR